MMVSDKVKFKVGDRVRAVKDGMSTTGAVGMLGYVRRVTSDDRAFPVQVELDAGGAYKSVAIASAYRWSWFSANALEPAVAAPLRIEAGKFYKTRDGRKVGPMEETRYKSGKGNPSWPFTVGLKEFWTESGKAYWDNTNGEINSEIVSEWPTYNANPAAEVDNLSDEYGAVVAKTERKFKVGDRVAFVDDYGSSARGTEATVVSVDGWGIMVNGVYGKSTEAPSSLRLVAPATSGKEMTLGDILAAALATPKKPAIVALTENGQPLPSHRPFVHPDREAALKEAKRLAGKHAGQIFGVYELVDTAQEAKVYDFDWQRLAASGRKIEAIKELRAQVGLTLTGAKKSVEHWLELNAA